MTKEMIEKVEKYLMGIFEGELKDDFPFSNGVRNYEPKYIKYTGKDVESVELSEEYTDKGDYIEFDRIDYYMKDGEIINEGWNTEVWKEDFDPDFKFKLTPKGEQLYKDIEKAFELIDKVYDDIDFSENFPQCLNSKIGETNIESFLHYITAHLIHIEGDEEFGEFNSEDILEEFEGLEMDQLINYIQINSEYFEVRK
jgi:hypothetical protein